MRMTKNAPYGTDSAMIAIPSQQEIDLQISQARLAQSAGLQHLMVSPFTALERRFHRTNPSTR